MSCKEKAAFERRSAAAKPAVTESVLMYQASTKIQSRSAHGRYARLRVIATVALLGLYYLVPWLSWHGQPLVLFDLPHRRFHILGLTLVPQDLLLLTALLLLAALTLFLFTSLAGRLWCGYACPQTVWTEAFLWIEQAFEGDRHQRLRLDRAPWRGEKLLKRGGKHLAWALFGLFTGLSFVAYFVPARELFPALLTGTLSGWALFWSLFYGFATWGNAGFMREQVCKYMCPYARFQSAMFDRDTLIIAYDDKRGEPRKDARSKGATGGDCVSCTLCVQVCPVGIDIRDGLQYECIACAACIDACDSVMTSVGKPRGLIRYTSANRDAGKPFRLLRPRTLGYGAVWLAACAGFIALLALHSPLRFDVLRDRHALYRELASGEIENVYTLKLSDTADQPRHYQLSARFADGEALVIAPSTFTHQPGEAGTATIALRAAARDDGKPSRRPVETVAIELQDLDQPGIHARRNARFLTGAQH